MPPISHCDITPSLIFYSAALNARTHGPLHSCRLALGTAAPQSPAAARDRPILPLACSLPVPRAPNRAEPQDREPCRVAPPEAPGPHREFLRSSASASLRPTRSDHAQGPPPHASHTQRASWSGDSGSKRHQAHVPFYVSAKTALRSLPGWPLKRPRLQSSFTTTVACRNRWMVALILVCSIFFS